MKHRIIICGVLAFSLLHAEEKLTIDRAVTLALEQNHQLKSAYHDLEAARWGKLSAYSYFLPKVDLSASITRIDPETYNRANASIDFIKAIAPRLMIPPEALANIKPFVYRDQYATTVTVIQPLYNGGAEIIGYRAANAGLDKSTFSYNDAEQEAITKTKTAYYSALKAQEFVQLSQEAIERTKRYLESTRRRAALGTRTETDVLRWEVQLASDEGNLLSAQNYLSMALLQLNETMGVDLNSVYVLDGGTIVDSLFGGVMNSQVSTMDSSTTGKNYTLQQVSSHPTLKVMDANLHLADINVSKSMVNFQPRVNLAFQYGWEKNNTLALDGIKPWGLSLSVSLPIFNSFGDYTSLEQSREEYQRAEEQIESYRSGLLMLATNARLSLRTAHKKIETAYKGLRQAREIVESVTHRYETGGASQIDLIDVQTAYTSAKTNYISAVYDYYMAQVQLARATGTAMR